MFPPERTEPKVSHGCRGSWVRGVVLGATTAAILLNAGAAGVAASAPGRVGHAMRAPRPQERRA
ncbi:MAG: hypothetical protein LC772_11355, partial [Chloroflexi bacterium]|nr:hypothetical protein [Chloroflexota bacterium]